MSTVIRRADRAVEDLGGPLLQFVVGEVRIALRAGDAAVAGKLLGQLEVAARAAQDGGDEVVAEGVGRDDAGHAVAQGFLRPLVDDGPAGSR